MASKTQATVTLSSSEAEYMAVAATTQEVLWRTILGELGLSVTEATFIHEVNQGCIAMLDQQLADILTKPLPRRVFERLRGLLLGM